MIVGRDSSINNARGPPRESTVALLCPRFRDISARS